MSQGETAPVVQIVNHWSPNTVPLAKISHGKEKTNAEGSGKIPVRGDGMRLCFAYCARVRGVTADGDGISIDVASASLHWLAVVTRRPSVS